MTARPVPVSLVQNSLELAYPPDFWGAPPSVLLRRAIWPASTSRPDHVLLIVLDGVLGNIKLEAYFVELARYEI
ncbi:hypothetical protein AEMCBJ_12795 [Cupriavidus necator]